MPTCGNCTTCNCYVTEDGIKSVADVLGRNTTRVTGSGTTADPFEISFLDQLEFRPRTSEIHWDDGPLFNSAGGGDGDWKSIGLTGAFTPDFKLYESPVVFVFRNPSSFTDHPYAYAQLNHFILGASATFAPTPGEVSTHVKQLILTAATRVSSGGFLEKIVVGGQTVPSFNNDSLTLSVEGYVPGNFLFTAGATSQAVTYFELYAFQESGISIALSDIKVWITEI